MLWKGLGSDPRPSRLALDFIKSVQIQVSKFSSKGSKYVSDSAYEVCAYEW